jgi:hypothetical protein
MNPAEELASQLIGAKQRYEDTGGLSQTLGFYRRRLFLQNQVGDEDYMYQYKTINGPFVSLPSYKTLLYEMRLKKNGDKVKAECSYIGDLFRSIDTQDGYVLLKPFVERGYNVKITVSDTDIKVRGMEIVPIHYDRLNDFIKRALESIGNTKRIATSTTFLGVDTEDDI